MKSAAKHRKTRRSSRIRSRIRRKWPVLVILLLLVACMIVVGVFPFAERSALQQSLQKFGHFAFFGLLAIVMSMSSTTFWPSSRDNRWRQYVIGFVASVAAGCFLELVQSFIPHRVASLSDALIDAWGALAGISVLALVDRPSTMTDWHRRAARLAFPALLFSVVMGVWPLVSCARDFLGRNAAFPIIVDFSAGWSRRFGWQSGNSSVRPTNPPADWPEPRPKLVGLVTFKADPDGYPGIGIRDSMPNWSGYDVFVFQAYGLGEEPFETVLRIHDFANEGGDDRFHRRLVIYPGYQEIRIALRDVQTAPRSRNLEMTSIQGVKLLTVRPTRQIEFLVGNWRLEKRPQPAP